MSSEIEEPLVSLPEFLNSAREGTLAGVKSNAWELFQTLRERFSFNIDWEKLLDDPKGTLTPQELASRVDELHLLAFNLDQPDALADYSVQDQDTLRLFVAEYKLALMRLALQSLKSKIPALAQPTPAVTEESDDALPAQHAGWFARVFVPAWRTFISYMTRPFFYVCNTVGLILAALGGVDGATTLFQIVGLSVPGGVGIAVGAGMGIAAMGLYYSLEFEAVREALGVSTNVELSGLLEKISKLIQCATQLNQWLAMHSNDLTLEEFTCFAQMAATVDYGLRTVRTCIQEYHEPWYKKVLRWSVLGVGMLLGAGDGVYTVVGIVSAATLVSNPVGIAILAVVAGASAIIALAMLITKVWEKINKPAVQIEIVKEDIEKYLTEDPSYGVIPQHLQAKRKTEKLEQKLATTTAINAKLQKELRGLRRPSPVSLTDGEHSEDECSSTPESPVSISPPPTSPLPTQLRCPSSPALLGLAGMFAPADDAASVHAGVSILPQDGYISPPLKKGAAMRSIAGDL